MTENPFLDISWKYQKLQPTYGNIQSNHQVHEPKHIIQQQFYSLAMAFCFPSVKVKNDPISFKASQIAAVGQWANSGHDLSDTLSDLFLVV